MEKVDNCIDGALDNDLPIAEETVKCEDVKINASPMLERSDFELLINGFRSYYDALARTIKVTKEKDATIARITKELQKYREGFSKSLKKPIAVSLISFTEDNKKTLREVDSYVKDKESIIKYLGFMVDDTRAILELYDITEHDGVFSIGDNPLYAHEAIPVPEVPDPVHLPEDQGNKNAEYELCSLSNALEFMKLGHQRVESLVKNNAQLDANLEIYRDIASSLDKHNSSMVLMPIYRKLAELYSTVKTKVSEAVNHINELDQHIDLKTCYASVLQSVINATTDLLIYMDVAILGDVNDEFDAKTSKILSIVNTQDPNLDKKVCVRFTDCYQLEGAIIYPSKVSVYKYVQE